MARKLNKRLSLKFGEKYLLSYKNLTLLLSGKLFLIIPMEMIARLQSLPWNDHRLFILWFP